MLITRDNGHTWVCNTCGAPSEYNEGQFPMCNCDCEDCATYKVELERLQEFERTVKGLATHRLEYEPSACCFQPLFKLLGFDTHEPNS